MGERHFGVDKGRIEPSVGERIDRIADRLGAAFVWSNVPGQGRMYWFACANRGDHSNAQCERDVWAALEAEGLAGAEGLLPCCFADRP